jgi:CRISPR/Cas system-associated exonuclease Cas4 (RecB family)
MRPIRASEIGTYLYCHRAWWYQQRGVQSLDSAELEAGSALHRRHGLKVFAARALRTLAIILLLAALALLAAYCTTRLI